MTKDAEISRGKLLKIKRLQKKWTQSTLLHFLRKAGLPGGLSQISFWENEHEKIPDHAWDEIKVIMNMESDE